MSQKAVASLSMLTSTQRMPLPFAPGAHFRTSQAANPVRCYVRCEICLSQRDLS